MIANVPISETGTSIIGRIIRRQSWRTAGRRWHQDELPSRRVWNTSFTDSRTNGVVSYTIW